MGRQFALLVLAANGGLDAESTQERPRRPINASISTRLPPAYSPLILLPLGMLSIEAIGMPGRCPRTTAHRSCRSALRHWCGSEPGARRDAKVSCSTIRLHWTHNLLVAGSIPAGPTTRGPRQIEQVGGALVAAARMPR
jgi:hypothetical protein